MSNGRTSPEQQNAKLKEGLTDLDNSPDLPESVSALQIWPLVRVLTEVRCGSQDWSWEEEWADLDQHRATELHSLEQQIRASGITSPVLIGSDGRLWDGHHRLRIAVHLGIGYIPVEIVPRTNDPEASESQVEKFPGNSREPATSFKTPGQGTGVSGHAGGYVPDPHRDVTLRITVARDPDDGLYRAFADRKNLGIVLTANTDSRALDMACSVASGRVLGRSGGWLGAEHLYLSTGCDHGDHGYCNAPTGLAGVKRAGHCKHCAAPCICSCHATRNGTTGEKPCACPHPSDEHSVYGCADGCGCEWMPVRLPSVVAKIRKDLDEARMWARHGYETGQQHCSWSDYGVAPVWLTDGWPPHFGTCDQLKKEAFDDHARSLAQVLRTDAGLRETEGLPALAAYGHELADLITPVSGP